MVTPKWMSTVTKRIHSDHVIHAIGHASTYSSLNIFLAKSNPLFGVFIILSGFACCISMNWGWYWRELVVAVVVLASGFLWFHSTDASNPLSGSSSWTPQRKLATRWVDYISGCWNFVCSYFSERKYENSGTTALITTWPTVCDSMLHPTIYFLTSAYSISFGWGQLESLSWRDGSTHTILAVDTAVLFGTRAWLGQSVCSQIVSRWAEDWLSFRANVAANDVAGNFSLTLIDVLDTFVVLDDRPNFEKAVRNVIDWVAFDVDTKPQVFETTIRVLGGLLSAHIFANRTGQPFHLPWYKGELLSLAHDLGNRLLLAFSTPTGLPYARVCALFLLCVCSNGFFSRWTLDVVSWEAKASKHVCQNLRTFN